MKKGFIQVYTGSGKGKTTAAFGLALRAVGQDLKVCVIQFMKSSDLETGEIKASRKFESHLKVIQFGKSKVWGRMKPKECVTQEMRIATERAFSFAKKVVMNKDYDIIILDEVLMAIQVNLLDKEDVVALMKNKPPEVEMVLTGRGAPKEIIEEADLVTDMVELKHPYQKGATARRGIEY